jgi:hypothetical protein
VEFFLQLPQIFPHNLTIYISEVVGGQQFAYLPNSHGLLLPVLAPFLNVVRRRFHTLWPLQEDFEK